MKMNLLALMLVMAFTKTGFVNFDTGFKRSFSGFDTVFNDQFNGFGPDFETTDKPTGTLTEAERNYAVDYLEKTKTDLLKTMQGLTAAQLTYKPDSARWSVTQCLEHIALAEGLIFQVEQGAMKVPAEPAKRSEIKVTDGQVITILTNRTGKLPAPEVIRPTGRFPDAQASLQAFTEQRDKTIQYIRTVQDDLRTHYWKHPATGTVDAYQVILLLAAHGERHRLQIEELKASPGFPKS